MKTLLDNSKRTIYVRNGQAQLKAVLLGTEIALPFRFGRLNGNGQTFYAASLDACSILGDKYAYEFLKFVEATDICSVKDMSVMVRMRTPSKVIDAWMTIKFEHGILYGIIKQIIKEYASDSYNSYHIVNI